MSASHAPSERVSAGHSGAEVRLRRLASMLATSPHNLVSAADRAAVYERHVLECDELARAVSTSGRWMDLGTGGGLPGLVLALRHPQTRWTLLDATAKKVAAVARFAAELDLPNAHTVHGRAEMVARSPEHRGRYQGVVARAVAPLATLAELGRGFLAADGLLVAVKGPGYAGELADAGTALRLLGLEVASVQQLSSPARQAWLVTMRARGDPPPRFPRRDGLPRHDPLR